MTSNRLLPVINALGCLLLVGFIVIQWFGSQKLATQLHQARNREILETNARIEAEKRADQIQSDIDGLKASVDSIQKAAEVAEDELASKNEEISKLATGLAQATEQIVMLEGAVKERDEAILKRNAAITERDLKLKDLNGQLVATRKRLDDAIAELKKAGAR